MDYELMSKWQNATFLQIYWRNKLIYILGVHFQHIFIGVNYSFKCETSLEPLPCSPLTTVYIYIYILLVSVGYSIIWYYKMRFHYKGFASFENDISTQLSLKINVKWLMHSHVMLSHTDGSNRPLITVTVIEISIHSLLTQTDLIGKYNLIVSMSHFSNPCAPRPKITPARGNSLNSCLATNYFPTIKGTYDVYIKSG